MPAVGLDIDGIAEEYVFKPNNPFMNDLHSFAKAKSLFRHGILSEAVYALEAEVQRKPDNVDAWRLLGTVHAENDDDTQAISAMARALKADPTNAEVCNSSKRIMSCSLHKHAHKSHATLLPA